MKHCNAEAGFFGHCDAGMTELANGPEDPEGKNSLLRRGADRISQRPKMRILCRRIFEYLEQMADGARETIAPHDTECVTSVELSKQLRQGWTGARNARSTSGPSVHPPSRGHSRCVGPSAEPTGVLKVSLSPTFGVTHILTLLPELLRRYPLIRPEWHFENRQVDLIAEGYDVAIGGGFDLAPGNVSRTLAPAHIVAEASPAYVAKHTPPSDPAGLSQFDGILMRSLRTGASDTG
jgi:hypothetical protein